VLVLRVWRGYMYSLSLSLRLFKGLFPTGKKESSVGMYVDDFKGDECHPYRRSCNSFLMRRWPFSKKGNRTHINCSKEKNILVKCVFIYQSQS
jgi:hypothetical protein